MKPIAGLLTLFLVMACVSCKSEKTEGENPFSPPGRRPYGVPPFDKIRAEHFLPALERGHVAARCRDRRHRVEQRRPDVRERHRSVRRRGRDARPDGAWFSVCSALRRTPPSLQALQERAMPLLAAHYDRILLDERLFARVKGACTTGAERWIWTTATAPAGEDLPALRARRGRCSTPGGRPA